MGLQICNKVNNHAKFCETTEENLEIDDWSNVRLSQRMFGKNYYYQTFVAGKRLTWRRNRVGKRWRNSHDPFRPRKDLIRNRKPLNLPNAEVWMAHSDTATLAQIRNLNYVTHDCPSGFTYANGMCECKSNTQDNFLIMNSMWVQVRSK